MSKNEKDIIRLIKQKIKQKDPYAEVVLFGSHARGDATPDSDWDVLILVNQQPLSRKIEKEYREELFDVELEVGEAISTLVLSKQDWRERYSVTPLYQNIINEGILL